jgi:hypothetical protein
MVQKYNYSFGFQNFRQFFQYDSGHHAIICIFFSYYVVKVCLFLWMQKGINGYG